MLNVEAGTPQQRDAWLHGIAHWAHWLQNLGRSDLLVIPLQEEPLPFLDNVTRTDYVTSCHDKKIKKKQFKQN
jgi:hypothetical protein